jgi:hypothetical protein
MAQKEKLIEITFVPWTTKIMEALTRVHVCIREKQDKIQEKDWEVLKSMHGLWFRGESPFYQTITYESKHDPIQTGLFDITNSPQSDNNGMIIATTENCTVVGEKGSATKKSKQ